MIKRHRFSLFFLLSIFAIFSCSELPKNPVVPAGSYPEIESYYPLTLKKYVVYDVSYITYSVSKNPDSIFYQLKETIQDTFVNVQKELSFRLLRSKRFIRTTTSINLTLDTTWQTDSVWHLRVTRSELIVTENNTPFVKMTNNTGLNSVWDGNKYNNRGIENYQITAVDVPQPNERRRWGTTLKIVHKNDSSAIGLDQTIEYYAAPIGLISLSKKKYEDACKFNFDGRPCIPGDKIATGYTYSQIYKFHGIEK